jgi:hypothetical protein
MATSLDTERAVVTDASDGHEAVLSRTRQGRGKAALGRGEDEAAVKFSRQGEAEAEAATSRTRRGIKINTRLYYKIKIVPKFNLCYYLQKSAKKLQVQLHAMLLFTV